MADNQDADIDEIFGQDDLELDEIVNEEEEVKTEEIKDADGNAGDDSKNDEGTGEDKASQEHKDKDGDDPEGAEPPVPDDEKPAVLTKEDLQTAITDIRDQERTSAKEMDELTDEVIKKYYPDGLSNVLVDEKTGKELRTPQDVVDASGGEMSIEEAWKWLTNEQAKVDKQVSDLKDEARNLAEVNANFNTGIERVINKYKPVFEAFKGKDIQGRVYKAYMKQVKIDEGKELVLSAPDIEEYYDLVMEPYLLAYGNMQAESAGQAPAPAPSAPAQPAAPVPEIPDAKPSIEDRLDESGDSASGGDNEADPNNADESLNKLFGE